MRLHNLGLFRIFKNSAKRKQQMDFDDGLIHSLYSIVFFEEKKNKQTIVSATIFRSLFASRTIV